MKYYNRVFLNKDEGVALVEIQCSSEDYNHDGKKWWSFSGDVYITDCSRGVTLDFHFSDVKEGKKKIEKMKRLIGELQAAQKVMEEEVKKRS